MQPAAIIYIAFLLMLIVAVLNSLGQTAADLDLWGYLAFGRLFWESGRFPYQDVFSFVPTKEIWVYHEWLTGVIFYPLYKAYGAAGLQLLRYGLGLLIVFKIYRTARLRGAGLVATVAVLWLIKSLFGFGFSPVRAQIFTYTFFALTLYLLERVRLRDKYLAIGWLIPLQTIWCNLHGGFLAGLGLISLYAVGEALTRQRWRPYLLALALSVLATLINPYGLDYWRYLLQAVAMPRPTITEWGSIITAWQSGMYDTCFYLAQVVLVTGLLLWWVRFSDVTAGLALGVTLVLAFLTIRHLAFFLLLVGAYLPAALGKFLAVLADEPGWRRFAGRFRSAVLACLIFSVVVLYGLSLLGKPLLAVTTPPLPGTGVKVYYPVGALEYIKKQGLSGRLLSDYNWGEYLIWQLYPRYLVAIDGRYETVYPTRVANRFLEFYDAKGDWESVLAEYQPDLILVNSRSRIYLELKRLITWRELYSDDGCALFGRTDNGMARNNQREG